MGNHEERTQLYAGNSEYPAVLAGDSLLSENIIPVSNNPSGADNQQERLAWEALKPESSETIRWVPQRRGEEMVPSAWRHAGVVP